MSVVIAVNSFVQGGAQRAAIELAKHLDRSGVTVSLICFYPEESDFFSLPEGVRVKRFIYPFHDRGRKISANKLLKILQRVAWRIADLRDLARYLDGENPTVIVAFEAYVGVLIGLANRNKRTLVISERVHPQYHKIAKILRPYQSFVYRRRNTYLNAQGREIAHYIQNKYGLKPVVAIPNIVSRSLGVSRNLDSTRIVCLARYTQQKGIDLLIDAWAQLNDKQRSNFTVHIYGDGERSEFVEQAKRRDVSDTVFFHAATHDVDDVLSDAALFILPSRYEGFPNALAEAMAAGLPCIATDCPSAVRDLTNRGVFARLVAPNLDSIAFALAELIGNPTMRLELGARASSVSEIFSPSQITNEWIEFLVAISNPHKTKPFRCKACGSSITNKDSVEVRTRAAIHRNLKVEWGIVGDLNLEQMPNLVYRFVCPKCGSSNYNLRSGSEEFYKACHASDRYTRTENWDYVEVVRHFGESIAPVRILDYGSGFSKFIELDPLCKFDLVALDIDESCLNEMRARGIDCVRSMSDLRDRTSFDVVMVSHYLEHVEDPEGFLKEIRIAMAEHGRIFVTVPDVESSEVNDSALDWPPHHLTMFSQNGLRKLLNKCGFDVDKIFPGDSSDHRFDFMIEASLSS